jgi:hypothetical protein
MNNVGILIENFILETKQGIQTSEDRKNLMDTIAINNNGEVLISELPNLILGLMYVILIDDGLTLEEIKSHSLHKEMVELSLDIYDEIMNDLS